MSSAGKRERTIPLFADYPGLSAAMPPKGGFPNSQHDLIAEGKQVTVSTSHRRNPRTGNYDGGGPFYTSRITPFIKPGYVERVYHHSVPKYWYSGPLFCSFPDTTEMKLLGYENPGAKFGDKNESQLSSLGTTAISLLSPTNPASDLGTTLAESFREGIPTLPGIQSWRRRTETLKGLGSEYLNYQFGWAPLQNEVSSVVDAARHHRDVLHQYHHGEGRNTHRRFDFPSERVTKSIADQSGSVLTYTGLDSRLRTGEVTPMRHVSLFRETKRWFEGCFTYGLPSQSDSWGKAIGFGSDADQLFGLALNPEILWELTPWSWAVDWFSNAGEVINNVTNFGLAGLVLRYGYMMEESIERITAEVGSDRFYSSDSNGEADLRTDSTSCSAGYETVTKRRGAASPFGFSVGWEGLSPTQLAITAALGITKLL